MCTPTLLTKRHFVKVYLALDRTHFSFFSLIHRGYRCTALTWPCTPYYFFLSFVFWIGILFHPALSALPLFIRFLCHHSIPLFCIP